jgi:hypothetical protein
MIFLFLPDHWNSKRHRLPRTFHPSSQIHCTVGTDNVRSPRFILVTYFAPKVELICFLNYWCYGLSVKFYSIVTTHVTKIVYIIYTLSRHNETLYLLGHWCKHTEVLERNNLLKSSVVLVHVQTCTQMTWLQSCRCIQYTQENDVMQPLTCR